MPGWTGPPLAAWQGALSVVIAPVSAFLAVRGARLAIVATPAGVVVRNFFVTRRVGWHEIAAINPPNLAGAMLDNRITFVLYDGRVVGATAFSGFRHERGDSTSATVAALRKLCQHRRFSSQRAQK